MCQIEKWISGVNWPLVISVSQALLALVIGGFLAYIARQQWKTPAYRVKLDLFDKRFGIFEQIKEMITILAITSPNRDQVLDFWVKTRGAEFLFGGEIKKFRQEIT